MPDDASGRARRVEAIFAAAVDAGDGAPEIVRRECAGDADLRREVETLLEAHRAFGPVDRLEDLLRRPASDDALSPGDRIAGYDIIGTLGAGGMGTVYAARDRRTGEPVAVKVLTRTAAAVPSAIRRFRSEARSAASLDHPNICRIREVGAGDDGRLFIAMPVYRGESLKERLLRGPLPLAEALAIALGVARGLAHAHERGVIHRDIKPGNLILDGGTVRILDFGIAKVADLSITTTGAVIGTVPYMSPEQAAGRPVDHRTDLWSLGVVLYEMLAGRRPFDGAHADETVAAILTRRPPPLPDGAGAAVAAPVLSLLLARPANERLPDAAAACAALEQALAAATSGAVWDGGGEAQPIAPEGERRHVAVLVTRVAAVDAETVPQLRQRAAEIAADHGGVLHASSDDAGGDHDVVMLFGVPSTHEDDPARCLRAAEQLHAWARSFGDRPGRLALQSGVAAGAVVVRPDARTRRHTVDGEPLVRAAELAASAARGSLSIAAGFPTRDNPSPHAAPFVGRDTELSLMRDAAAAAALGEGQCVLVEGEAGAGKSRLVDELRCSPALSAYQVVRVACRADGAGGAPYRPFADIVRSILGVGDIAPRDLRSDDIAARLGALAPELPALLPVHMQLLGFSAETDAGTHADGDSFRQSVRDALAALVTVAARERPLALLLEDWHWADEPSRESLVHLVALARPHALLIVATCRPGHDVPWPATPAASHIALRPLDAAATRAIAHAVLGSGTVPEETVATIHRRAGGNPLFTEEICRALAERGGATTSVDLPASVHGVIRTRLDRLDPAARELARAASVIGREFTLHLVHAVAGPVPPDAALERLRRASILDQTRFVPQPAYRFRHVLVQEVAYDTLVPERRRDLHAVVGTALEAAGGEPEVLAHHFGQAEQWERAARHGDVAAQRAHALYDFPGALRMAEQAEEWAHRIAEGSARHEALVAALLLQERCAETLGLRDRQKAILARAGLLLDQNDSPAMRSEIFRRRGELHADRQEYAESRRLLEEALALALQPGGDDLERKARTALGLLCWHEGRHQEGLGHLRRAAEIGRSLGDAGRLARDLFNLSVLLTAAGEHAASMAMLNEARAAAESAGDAAFGSHVSYRMGLIHRQLGDRERAHEAMSAAVEIGTQHNLLLERAVGLIGVAHEYVARGDMDGALQHYREAVDAARRVHYPEALSHALTILATVLANLGRTEEALPHLREAAEVLAALGKTESGAAVRLRIAQLEARSAARDAREMRKSGGDPATARVALESAIARAADAGERALEGELRNSAGIIEWEAGRWQAALAHYERACTLFAEMRDLPRLGLALNSIGATLLAAGRPPEAIAQLTEAVACNRAATQPLLEGHALATLGDAHRAMSDSYAAAAAYEESLEIRRRIGDRRGEGWMLLRLGRVEEARRIAEELADPELAGETARPD